jgi:glycosyltransferase involved in cell wall biosynthesis
MREPSEACLEVWSEFVKTICFVTEECVGIAEAGGIGACVRGLSQWLTDTGCKVDLLITNLSYSAENTESSASSFAHHVYYLSDVSAANPSVNPPFDEPSKSYHVYLFLKQRGYDEVHFHDYQGVGFYTAMARRMGMFGAKVITHLHGSSQWVRRYNLNPPELRSLEQEALEKSLIENSDEVISPSRYLLEWYRSEGVSLPASCQRSWVLPQWVQPSFRAEGFVRTRAIAAGEVDEIIYFGRHERRKGFKLFVDAVAALPEGSQPDVTFIGRFDRIAGEHSGSYALRKLRDHPGRLRFLSDYKQPEALGLLKRSRRALVVMPSLIENSPCVIGECFTVGVPFLTTDVGGVGELVSETSKAHCLTAPNASELSGAILRVLKSGMPALISTLNPQTILESWKASVEGSDTAPATSSISGSVTPLVSVCFTHFERPHLLRRALDAILAQTYENIEIIVVDDGSRSSAAISCLEDLERVAARFPIAVIRTPNRFLGAARNSAAKAAKGEFLMFHDDDNYAEPHEVETFVAAALNYNADILTSLYYVFRDGEDDSERPKRQTDFYTFGVGGEFSFFLNRFGDANALIRRSVFEEIGGFTEEFGLCFEDWEFFLKAHFAGKRMGIVPEPLFNYRVSPTGMLATGDAFLDYERIYRAIDQLRPRVGADLVRFAYGQQLTQLALGRTMQVLARERGGDLMQQLAGAEPNSREAIALLSDLAMKFGRFTDAIELASRDSESRGRIEALMRDPAVVRRLRGKYELVVIEPSAARDAALIAGWAIDGEGAPLNLPVIWVAGSWWRVASARRERRPDVRDAFNLSSEHDLGFRLYAFAAEGGAPGVEEPAMEAWRPMDRVFRQNEFEANLPAGPGWLGQIERGEWQRAAKIVLPESLDGAPILEIETSVASDPVVVWADGVLDWGKRVTANRVHFAREGHGGARDLTVIAPSHVRAHVTMS